MAIFIVPISADPRQVQTTTLDGVDYQLDLDWIGRQASWSLSVRSPDGPLTLGLRLCPGTTLLSRRGYRDDAPEGILVVDGDPAGIPPGLDDFASGIASLVFATGDNADALAGLPG